MRIENTGLVAHEADLRIEAPPGVTAELPRSKVDTAIPPPSRAICEATAHHPPDGLRAIADFHLDPMASRQHMAAEMPD